MGPFLEMKTRLLLSASFALATIALADPALAACSADGARALPVGKLEQVPAGSAPRFAVDLAAGEGLQIELAPVAAAGSDDGDEHDSKAPATGLSACDATGRIVAPLPSEVFASGGSLARADDGTLTLRLSAPKAGRYVIATDAADVAREILLRPRAVSAQPRPATPLEIGGSDFVKISKGAPRVWSFAGKAGQWVKITATSESDTVLHLAAPVAGGGYEVIADNDDSDGLNPKIQRKLPATGTYYVQLESLSDETNDATVVIQPTQAPPPPPPPAALRAGTPVQGKLASSDDTRLYTLPVVAGRSYRLELNAPYDAVLEVGQPDPLEPEDGKDGAGFAASRTVDDNTSGTEKMNITARTSGQLLVRVRAFSVGDDGGDYTLIVKEAGN